MRITAESESLWSGLGMSSIVLGLIALLLFFMPVLGIPIAGCGLAIGLAGLAIAMFCRCSSPSMEPAGRRPLRPGRFPSTSRSTGRRKVIAPSRT